MTLFGRSANQGDWMSNICRTDATVSMSDVWKRCLPGKFSYNQLMH